MSDPLKHEVESALGADQPVIGVFSGHLGPRLGIESLLGLVVPLLLIVGNPWLAGLAAALLFLAVGSRRQAVCVAITSDEAVLFRLSRFGGEIAGGPERHPKKTVRVSPAAIGDDEVRLGPDRVWVRGDQHDEARRLIRLARGDSGRGLD